MELISIGKVGIDDREGASIAREGRAKHTRVNDRGRNKRSKEGSKTRRKASDDTPGPRVGVIERVVDSMMGQDRGERVNVARMAMGLLYAGYVIGAT